LPLRMNTGLSLGNTRSRITSLKGSPTIGSSAGLVLWLTSTTHKCACYTNPHLYVVMCTRSTKRLCERFNWHDFKGKIICLTL
jgi:hypothetical protein